MRLSSLGAAHFAAALAALALGALVLLGRKGTPAHRALGASYVTAMALVNLTALGIWQLTGRLGPFHALALASLATVAWGFAAALRRRPGWLLRHYHSMAWSYVGLLAAASAEAAIRVPAIAGAITSASRATALGLGLAALFLLLGFLIVPRLAARAVGSLGRVPP